MNISHEKAKEAVEALLELAQTRGEISKRRFDLICRDHFADPKVVASWFKRKTQKEWFDFKMQPHTIERKRAAAREFASKRLDSIPSPYREKVSGKNGFIYPDIHGNELVYIGSQNIEGEVVHYCARVDDLTRIQFDWQIAYDEHPLLADFLLGDLPG